MEIRSVIKVVPIVLVCLALPSSRRQVYRDPSGGNTNGAGTQNQTFNNSECYRSRYTLWRLPRQRAGSGWTTSISQNDCITAYVDSYNNNVTAVRRLDCRDGPERLERSSFARHHGCRTGSRNRLVEGGGTEWTGDYVFSCTVSGTPTACYPSISFGDYQRHQRAQRRVLRSGCQQSRHWRRHSAVSSLFNPHLSQHDDRWTVVREQHPRWTERPDAAVPGAAVGRSILSNSYGDDKSHPRRG